MEVMAMTAAIDSDRCGGWKTHTMKHGNILCSKLRGECQRNSNMEFPSCKEILKKFKHFTHQALLCFCRGLVLSAPIAILRKQS